jgi:hypothetical protein
LVARRDGGLDQAGVRHLPVLVPGPRLAQHNARAKRQRADREAGLQHAAT